ncbi:MAG: DUF4363 family protein [Clostridiales bacterium]|nr:DUF4363 family protein [Clostridiales bacterium]
MKRVYAAIGILLAVAVLCVTTLKFQSNNIKELILIVEKIEDAYKKDDIESCIELSYEFAEKYKTNTGTFPFFMRHSDVSKIEETIVTLPIMLKTDDIQHFAAELARCKNMLVNMADLEMPSLGNIM